MAECKKIECCSSSPYGYQPTFEATATYTALCPVGETGDPVTVQKTATSQISYQDAYDIAVAQATEEAQAGLSCVASNNFDFTYTPTGEIEENGIFSFNPPDPISLTNQTYYAQAFYTAADATSTGSGAPPSATTSQVYTVTNNGSTILNVLIDWDILINAQGTEFSSAQAHADLSYQIDADPGVELYDETVTSLLVPDSNSETDNTTIPLPSGSTLTIVLASYVIAAVEIGVPFVPLAEATSTLSITI